MKLSEKFQVNHNVLLRVIDKATGKVTQEHSGHNAATNTLVEGVGHYLAGEGIFNQTPSMLSDFIPRYISLGTMGLNDQSEDSNGLPTGISGYNTPSGASEAERFEDYINERPGYGSDGYSRAYNNGRPFFGLGPAYTSFSSVKSYYRGDVVYYNGVSYTCKNNIIVNPETGIYNLWKDTDANWEVSASQPKCWELITQNSPRTEISFRSVLPEYEAGSPRSIDVVFSAMISTDAFSEFRASNKNYMFVTEAGLWSSQEYQPDGSGVNGMIAGYRVAPPSRSNWYMNSASMPDQVAIDYLAEQGVVNPTSAQISAAKVTLATANRQNLKEQVLRVEQNQVVQVIWKIQIGDVDEESLTV